MTKVKWQRRIGLWIIFTVVFLLVKDNGYSYGNWQFWAGLVGTVIGTMIFEDAVEKETMEEGWRTR